MRLVRGVLVCAVVAILVPLAPRAAHACTCEPGDPRARLLASEAAAIVSPVEVPSGVSLPSAPRMRWRFEVREAVKGELGTRIEVESAASGAMCGLGTLEPGGEYGLFLHRDGAAWTSGLCSQIDPDTLRRAALPLAKPSGLGRAAFILAAPLGEARTLVLDSKFRTLRYGVGSGEALRVAVCPGARTSIELVRTAARPAPYLIGVRRLGSFALEREIPLSDIIDPQESLSFHALTCRDPTAAEILVFASRGVRKQATARLLRVDSSGQHTVWEGKGVAAVIPSDARRAFVIDGLRKLSEVDLTSGNAREIRTIREEPDYEVHLSPDERRIAWYATTGYPGGFLCVVDLVSAEQRYIPVQAGGMTWTTQGRILFWSESVRLYDTKLEPLRAWEGWESSPAAIVVGDRVYGYGNGRIQVASVRDGHPEIVRRFDSPTQAHLVAVPDVDGSREGVATWAVLAAALSLGALLVTAWARLRWGHARRPRA